MTEPNVALHCPSVCPSVCPIGDGANGKSGFGVSPNRTLQKQQPLHWHLLPEQTRGRPPTHRKHNVIRQQLKARHTKREIFKSINETKTLLLLCSGPSASWRVTPTPWCRSRCMTPWEWRPSTTSLTKVKFQQAVCSADDAV